MYSEKWFLKIDGNAFKEQYLCHHPLTLSSLFLMNTSLATNNRCCK